MQLYTNQSGKIKMDIKRLVIVVPCYNEEAVLPYSVKELTMLLDILIEEELVSKDSQICFVNDGSNDKTQEIIENLCKVDKKYSEVKLAKNFGHQYALLAGMYNCNADIIVTIDADLQDDHMTIMDMVKKSNEGYDIVYGVRNKRTSDTFFKRTSAELFYKLMDKIGVKLIFNHADFRLLSRNAVERLKEYKERTVFLRGLVPLLGLRTCSVYYDRLERIAGESKYPLLKMLAFAWNGIVSFSVFPILLISSTGFITLVISLFLFIYTVVYSHFTGIRTMIFLTFFFSGIILLSIGIIGEYLGKVLTEVKCRPLYQVEKTINL